MCAVLVGAQAAAADRVLVGVERLPRAHRAAGGLLHAVEERQEVLTNICWGIISAEFTLLLRVND